MRVTTPSIQMAKLFLSVKVQSMKPQQEVTPIWNSGFYFGMKYIYAIGLAVSGKNF